MAKQEATLLDLGTHGFTGAVPVGITMSPNSCGICSGKVDLKTSAALQEHLKKVHFYCESCRWFAESAELLGQHNESIHHIYATSAKIVSNGQGVCGHLTKHNFHTIKCYCCDDTFISVSSMFYHLENESCPSGINRQDIEKLTTYYLYYLHYQGVFLYYCGRCRRPFRSMFDLLRHVEDIPCMRWGLYGRGSLIDYIATNIGSLIKCPIENADPDVVRIPPIIPTDDVAVEERITNPDPDNVQEDKVNEIANKDIMLIPSIIITRVDGSSIKW
ncbi:hypothetical protein EMCG_07700 [[Emmonsia] crescens]|uniref:C2H2-type domain-containing protein n=1 Tax=[Emmonsia] crescens TaxID=73230 RepID=A0A0G2JAZ4_9EURO|nr:hypothetical protein EMCG_07700 [Emmonsia crescens UAMH 3008]